MNFFKNILNKFTIKSNTGSLGEDSAVKYLKKNGFKIVERNFSSKSGEIDIIATDGEVLVFVEVKTRGSVSHGRASEAVDSRKQKRIIKTTQLYLVKKYGNNPPEVRFDIVEVYHNEGVFDCELIEDAFQADW